ncbi:MULTISPECIES: hypothetical protein [Rhizobium]|uniref:Uncharacterized protein n=1 Tax=Rhizobium paranaense TaxID=1650438 RepID=A0A7W9D1S9_9HYPH|nr:hypothetical protein [Rhizobium paranaense]MBB5574654.1 hypothetical protein [Rhizobium paranaense]
MAAKIRFMDIPSGLIAIAHRIEWLSSRVNAALATLCDTRGNMPLPAVAAARHSDQ